MIFRRVFTVAMAAFVMVLFSGTLAQAAPVDTDTTSCNGVLNGGNSGGLTKQVTSIVSHGDGTFTINFSFTSPRPNGTYRLRDCAFIDANHNGSFDSGETVFGTDNKTVTLVNGKGTGSITVRGGANDTVCDRLALSSDATGTDKSNTVCKPLREFVIPPGTVGLAGLTGLLGLGFVGAFFLRRRFRGPSTA